MLLPVEEIKKGITHPDPLVRQQALNYFTESWSTDTTIMPVAVEALQKYGRDDAFKWPATLGDIPQTRETFLWFVSELERGDAPTVTSQRDFLYSLSTIIASADVALLQEHQAKILALPELHSDAESQIKRRLEMSLLDADACWRELEEVCEESRTEDAWDAVDIGKGDLLTEAIARHAGSAERVLSLVSMKVDRADQPLVWMQSFAIQIAGRMRLAQAVPALVATFAQSGEFDSDNVVMALGKIGGDATVEAICHDFAIQSRMSRYVASAPLERIRSPRVVARCLQLAEAEEDEEIRGSLVLAALNNFAFEAIEPASKLAANDSFKDLTDRLFGVAALMEITSPEISKLKQDREDKAREEAERLAARRRSVAAARDEPPPAPPRPIKAAPKVGRNDPCPCGSGKKYKKCCMGKE